MNGHIERWKGRHSTKDKLRAEVWSTLEAKEAAIGNPWSTIPNFKGSREAAEQLGKIPEWANAKVVKCNPDAAQAWIRYNALSEGKRVYTPVPELVADFPFLLLDPDLLREQNISLDRVMYSQGALTNGVRCNFKDLEPIDFAVVGCVAVTEAGGRTGKGAGFADLEMGIFRHYGVLPENVPVATTVHDIQIVENNLVVMEAHDTPLDYIATAEKLIATDTKYETPCALEWDKLQPDQYENIPFLNGLKSELQAS
tara:strand:- start:175 stop:939 length:765 start_codon:yes stop_codon:yes gene_type:complete